MWSNHAGSRAVVCTPQRIAAGFRTHFHGQLASPAGFILGECWECASPFEVYPGFAADPYVDYSLPWFGSHAELRGAGSRLTHAVLRRLTFRNFYLPQRRDPFVGFRTAF